MDYSEELYANIGRIQSKLVIVEGIRDKAALEQLGLKNIVTLTKPIYAVVEEIAAQQREVVILTDLDKEGKQLYGRLSSGLQRHGVIIDNHFRNFLIKNTQLRQIEGISNYFAVDPKEDL